MKKISVKERKNIKRIINSIQGIKKCNVYNDCIVIYVSDIDNVYYNENSLFMKKFFIQDWSTETHETYFLFGKKKFNTSCVDYNDNSITFELKE